MAICFPVLGCSHKTLSNLMCPIQLWYCTVLYRERDLNELLIPQSLLVLSKIVLVSTGDVNTQIWFDNGLKVNTHKLEAASHHCTDRLN